MEALSHRFWMILMGCLAVFTARAASGGLDFDQLKLDGALRSELKGDSWVTASGLPPEPQLGLFQDTVQPILEQHCVPCHGPEKSKARLRLDQLDPNLQAGSDADWWMEVRAVIGNGEMPPPEESDLPFFSQQERDQVIGWLTGEIRTASALRRAATHPSSFRRLTAYEYNHALQDLLGLPWEFARDLPPEARSEDGFENSVENLHMSVSQLETYRDLARKALKRAAAPASQPPTLYWGISMEQASKSLWEAQLRDLEALKETHKEDPSQLQEQTQAKLAAFSKPHGGVYYKQMLTGRTAPHRWDYGGAKYAVAPSLTLPKPPASHDTVAILPPGGHHKLVIELGDQVPDEGILRVRVRASRLGDPSSPNVPSLQLHFGWQASNEGRALMRVSQQDIPVAATSQAPEFYQWDIPLGDIYPRNAVKKLSPMGATPSPSEHIRLVNSAVSQGDIQIDYVEVIAPYYASWPPDSHRRLFFDSVHRDQESLYAKELLSYWMPRMWRRSVSQEELARKVTLFHAIRPQTPRLEEAMVEVLATVLSSPHFLYLGASPAEAEEAIASQPMRLSQYALASRLAAFLWCSIPDDRLLELAKRSELMDQTVLSAEIDRMLADPRAERMAQYFVHQWLEMDRLEYLKPDHTMNQALKEAMQQEPILLFLGMLRDDRSLLDFLHSDHTFVNEPLARHYGLQGIHGNEFQRVALEPKDRRGGLLAQAGLLAMNTTGEDTNPLKRGIWMLKNILNDPPPPPPPTVPRIDLADPAIAKMSLKERLADHRNQAACMGCHAKIDPWGIALESYDARGQWREEIQGKPVDATSLLPGGQVLEGMDGLKGFLLENRQDQFILAMTRKLCVFALGRPLNFADQAAVETIATQLRRQGDGLATLIRLIGTSELFFSQ